jgi:hypothetical protein
MKLEQVNKLYKHLAPAELGSLAIEAISRGDDNELHAIVQRVERRTYTAAHKDYRDRLQGFERLALYYGTQYWKYQAFVAKAFQLEENDEGRKVGLQCLTELCAMELALVQVCKLKRLKVESVKWLADCKGFDEVFPLPVHCNAATNGLLEQYKKTFTKIVNNAFDDV